ncbi:putative DNA/RNA polymerase superfamily [Helianthus annuus]|nr:putative DNA/RNA polymerase superfamily [Helianthus annuus]KAJ0583897.1 putative DNA/RNA polymerase superfamily [Helianthus annuus]
MKAPILMPHLEENEVQRLPLNISAIIAGHKVSRIHVDGGPGVEVIYEHCFLRFDRDVRDRLEEDSIPLVGFNNSVSHPLGKIRLPFTVGVGDRVRTINLTFTVVRAPSKYNAILGRPGIGDLQAQASTPHEALVFQTPKGLAWVKSAYEVVSSVSKGETLEKPQGKGVEEWVLCDRFPEQTVKVGSHLSDKCKSALKELLLHNIDVFAFQHGDMTGIPRSLTEHRLNTFTWAKPVKQKKRSMGPNKRRAACEETRKLLRAGIVREVKYPSWVANPVMVQKKDGGGGCASIFKI